MAKEKVLILSLIPVRKSGRSYETDNRWAKDINMQAEFHSIRLLCPVEEISVGDPGVLSPDIQISNLADSNLDKLLKNVDLVQLPGNFGWKDSRIARRLLRLAIKNGTPVFVGISSDRAKTKWMNRKSGPIGAARGMLGWLDVRSSQRSLTSRATGVFVVGSGIRKLAQPNSNVHVGIASWISASDILVRPPERTLPIRICCASRLEAMKGVEIGIHAVAQIAGVCRGLSFDVVGEGPERSNLVDIVERSGLRSMTRFLGQLSYPDAFLSYLRTVDFVLLTNLGDEQPRLIFDAISQGCLPICPDSPPYLALGLDARLLYERGSSDAAAGVIARFVLMSDRERREIEASLRHLAKGFTLEAMHRHRANWMAKSIPVRVAGRRLPNKVDLPVLS
jgi:glycosyltransferase involved in cell wall biosynthesis